MGVKIIKTVMARCSFEKIPDDIVFSHIISRIVDVTTRVRFGAVCRSWRALSRKAPSLSPRIYVMDCSAPKNWFTNNLLPTLFDPVSTTSHRLLNPMEEAKTISIGGFQGPYLAYSPYPDPTFLFSPFSGRTLAQLPCTVRYPDGRREPVREIFSKVRLSSHPVRLVAAVGRTSDSRVHICRAMPAPLDLQVDSKAEWVVSEPLAKLGLWIYDLIFYKGELYSISNHLGRILAYDLQSHLLPLNEGGISCPTPRIICAVNKDEDFDPDDYTPANYNLVESGGELLVITQYFHEDLTPKIWFQVHRLDLDKGTLIPVDSLGDRMLFIGQSECCISWPGPELDNSFFVKNYIYFFHKSSIPKIYRLGRYRVGSKLLAEFLPIPVVTGFSPLWINVPTHV